MAVPVTASAAVSNRSNLFLEMMLAMMEIMGMIDRDRDYYSQPYPVLTPGYNNQMQNALQMLALQQMMNNYGGNLNGINPQTIVPFLPDYTNAPAPSPANHWIEGKWRSSDGMIMEVRQGQFKMYYSQTPQNVRGGLIRIKDKWLAIYESSHQFTRQYEFAYKDNRLVLKDTSGNMMLFKRMTNWAVPAIR